jgi:hypothetical protein
VEKPLAPKDELKLVFFTEGMCASLVADGAILKRVSIDRGGAIGETEGTRSFSVGGLS